MRLSLETKFIILSHVVTDEIEWELFRIGVRGFCKIDVESGLLRAVVEAVRKGELWIRRSLSWRLLNELVTMTREQNQIRRTVSELLSNLTRREYEIATLVGNGRSHKKKHTHTHTHTHTHKRKQTNCTSAIDYRAPVKAHLHPRSSVSWRWRIGSSWRSS